MSYVEGGYVEAGYIGQPGSLCRFALGDSTLNFDQAPLRPEGGLELLQAVGRSAGAVPFGHEVRAADDRLTLRWPQMQSYYAERVQDWFINTADGMANVFTWRDRDGVEIGVRFAEPVLPEITERAADRFDVTVHLLRE